MDWARFKENPYWIKIAQLLKDRASIVLSDIAQVDKTPELLGVRVLQQELIDIQFFLSIPDLFIQSPDEELDNGLAADN